MSCAIKMMNKKYRYIASLCLRILIGFLLTSKPVFSNQIIDLIHTIKAKSETDIRSKMNPGLFLLIRFF